MLWQVAIMRYMHWSWSDLMSAPAELVSRIGELLVQEVSGT